MAANQDVTLWLSAMASFQSAAATSGVQTLDPLKEGTNWLAAVEALDDDDKKRITDFVTDLDVIQPQRWEFFDNDDRVAMLAGVAAQSTWESAESRKRVIDTVTAIKVGL